MIMTTITMISMRGMRGSRGSYTPRGGGVASSQQAASGLVISNVSNDDHDHNYCGYCDSGNDHGGIVTIMIMTMIFQVSSLSGGSSSPAGQVGGGINLPQGISIHRYLFVPVFWRIFDIRALVCKQ